MTVVTIATILFFCVLVVCQIIANNKISKAETQISEINSKINSMMSSDNFRAHTIADILDELNNLKDELQASDEISEIHWREIEKIIKILDTVSLGTKTSLLEICNLYEMIIEIDKSATKTNEKILKLKKKLKIFDEE